MADAPPSMAAEPRVEPMDEFNRRLIELVHPPDWRNPRPRDRYDLVVIGAGTGGLVTAAIAAGLGARVALIERHLMGGDCLNVGCVPSKALLRAARAWHAARRAEEEFGGPAAVGAGDFGTAMSRMRRLRAELGGVDSAARFRELGVDVFLGHGRFPADDVIEVAGQRLRFRRAVIATGARAAVPPVPGLAATGYLTNESIFSLTELPQRLVVLGAGPIGCELAQAFARFGSRVTVLDPAPRILAQDDPDAARVVAQAMQRDGVEFQLGVRVTGVERSSHGSIVRFEREGQPHEAAGDRILVATGRAPNVEELGLEHAGVTCGPHGIIVDDRLRTSNRRIYAVGDVCSVRRFTHVSDAHARLVVANALFFGLGGGRVSELVVPWCTYTSPELAHTGLTAAEAEVQGRRVRTVAVPRREVDRAVLDGDEEGFARVYLDHRRDRILGATLVGAHAGEMISEMTLAIRARLGLGAIGDTIHPYPTEAAILRRTADVWRRSRFTPRARRATERLLRLFR